MNKHLLRFAGVVAGGLAVVVISHAAIHGPARTQGSFINLWSYFSAMVAGDTTESSDGEVSESLWDYFYPYFGEQYPEGTWPTGTSDEAEEEEHEAAPPPPPPDVYDGKWHICKNRTLGTYSCDSLCNSQIEDRDYAYEYEGTTAGRNACLAKAAELTQNAWFVCRILGMYECKQGGNCAAREPGSYPDEETCNSMKPPMYFICQDTTTDVATCRARGCDEGEEAVTLPNGTSDHEYCNNMANTMNNPVEEEEDTGTTSSDGSADLPEYICQDTNNNLSCKTKCDWFSDVVDRGPITGVKIYTHHNNGDQAHGPGTPHAVCESAKFYTVAKNGRTMEARLNEFNQNYPKGSDGQYLPGRSPVECFANTNAAAEICWAAIGMGSFTTSHRLSAIGGNWNRAPSCTISINVPMEEHGALKWYCDLEGFPQH